MSNKANFSNILRIILFLTILGLTTTASGKIIYVDDDATGVNDGSSWENAYKFLQDALTAASDGDEIRVAKGIYTPDSNSAIPDGTGNREATFQLANDVSLLGGYAGSGSTDPDTRDIEAYQTILSGDLNGDDVDVNSPEDLLSEPTREDNVIRIVMCSGSAVLDGFTITGGDADEPIGGRAVPESLGNEGSGIYNDSGNLTINNCTFSANAGDSGGGIYNSDGELSIKGCTFKGNYAGRDGGGICNIDGQLSVTDCTITGNNAGDGGGIYTDTEPTIDNCTFTENTGSNGSGIYNSQSEIPYGNPASNSYSSTPTYPGEPGITNCTFIDNTSDYFGGGIYNNNSSPTITNCIFIRNMTKYEGGGIYNDSGSSPNITNCTFVGNSSAQDGGGIYSEKRFEWTSSGDLILTNCMFNGNVARLNGGALYINEGQVYLINCTFAQNSAEDGATLACESSGSDDCTAHIFNCILWDGDNGIWLEENSFEDNSTVNIYYSDIYGGWEGVGNIDEDPIFVDQLGPDLTAGTEDDDLRLAPVSLCVNAGDPNYPAETNETDLDGNPRIVSGVLDMGAYEFQGILYVDDDAPYDIPQGEPQIDYPEEDGTDARPFDTIQEAIDVAADGYTILVLPGAYNQIDFMGKAITIAGTEGAAIIETSSEEQIAGSLPNGVTFHTGEGSGSMLKNFIIRKCGTAISLNYGSSPSLYNLTIVENDFGITSYENSDPDITNCILWNNTNGDLFQCRAKYSSIETGADGEGNISINPLFVDASNGDYHLKSEGWRWNSDSESWTWDDVTSQCIDAGDPVFPLGDEPMSVPRDPDNLYGTNRCINMGAFGGTVQASMPPIDWSITEEDNNPPIPDPARWARDGAPQEVNIGGGEFDFWVQMTATEATDDSGFVEYFFECTTTSGFSSGWQTSNEYSVLIGRGEQNLRFRVKARDLYLNETDWSEERTAH